MMNDCKLKIMDIDKVIIPAKFKETPPSYEKVKRKKKYFKKHNQQQKPIVIDENNILSNGYATYLALLELGENSICYVNDEFERKTIYKIPAYRNNPTIYVYGIHIFRNGEKGNKEFVWRIPDSKREKMINTISVGDKVVVNTKYGNKVIVVTRIVEHDTCPVENNVRKVLYKMKGK